MRKLNQDSQCFGHDSNPVMSIYNPRVFFFTSHVNTESLKLYMRMKCSVPCS